MLDAPDLCVGSRSVFTRVVAPFANQTQAASLPSPATPALGRCAEDQWPGVSGAGCAECRALVAEFNTVHRRSCARFCARVGLRCVGMWEDSGEGTCAVLRAYSSCESGPDSPEAICECAPPEDEKDCNGDNDDDVRSPVINTKVAVADLTGDGLMDMIVLGSGDGDTQTFRYWRNVGSPTEPALERAGNEISPVPELKGYSHGSPALIDLTGDSLVDLIVSNMFGELFLFRNNGTTERPDFTMVQPAPLSFAALLSLH